MRIFHMHAYACACICARRPPARKTAVFLLCAAPLRIPPAFAPRSWVSVTGTPELRSIDRVPSRAVSRGVDRTPQLPLAIQFVHVDQVVDRAIDRVFSFFANLHFRTS